MRGEDADVCGEIRTVVLHGAATGPASDGVGLLGDGWAAEFERFSYVHPAAAHGERARAGLRGSAGVLAPVLQTVAGGTSEPG